MEKPIFFGVVGGDCDDSAGFSGLSFSFTSGSEGSTSGAGSLAVERRSTPGPGKLVSVAISVQNSSTAA